jgi:hypothetical protein
MGILDDVKRLGLKLNEEDENGLEIVRERAKVENTNASMLETRLEYYIGEYLSEMRPDIMSALEKNREAVNKELIGQINKKYDDHGKRICDEVSCLSAMDVVQCPHCERFICAQHNYGQARPSCYACFLEHGGKGA